MSVKAQLNKFFKKIEKELKKDFSKRGIQEAALFIVRLVRERTRQGFGVRQDRSGRPGRRFRLPDFSESYIEQRERFPRLSPFAFIDSPNNTLTGKMLSDKKVSGVRKDGFSIGFKSRQSRLKAEYLAEMGREFLNLSQSEFDLLVDFFRKRVKSIRV